MADNNEFIVDKLVLDIEVKDGNSKEDSSSKKVRSLATAISLLNRNINNFDSNKMADTFAKMGSSVKDFANSLKGANKTIQAMATIIKSSGIKKVAETSALIGKSVGTANVVGSTSSDSGSASVLGGASAELASGVSTSLSQSFDKLDILREKLAIATKEFDELSASGKDTLKVRDSIASLTSQIERLEKPTKRTTSSFGKMIKSFTRVAGYRAIRRVLRELASGLSDTFKAIGQVDPAFNSTMSNITSSIDMLKTSLGVGLYQTLAVLEPLIAGLTNIVTSFANSMAKVGAVMKGQGTYLKINTDYLKDYASAMQGVLLPFDEFTTLGSSGSIDYSQMLEEAAIGDAEEFTGLEKALKDLGEAFKNVWNDFIKPVWDGLQKFFGWLNKNDLLVGFLGGVLAIVLAIKAPLLLLGAGIMYFIGSFEKLGSAAQVLIPVLAGVFAVVAALIVASHGLGAALAAGAIVGGVALIGITAAALADTKNYAFGGNYQSADMFYANENGRTEMVASNNSGGGSVMTMDMWGQISEASFYNALVAYDAKQNGNDGGGININGLGRAVASSSGFTNEVNRRNPNLNLV